MHKALLEVICPDELPVEYGGSKPGKPLEGSKLEKELQDYVQRLQKQF